MNRKFLVGIIILLVALVIALFIIRPVLGGFILAGLSMIGIWFYLQYTIRRKKAKNLETDLADNLVKRLKIFLAISGISLVVGIIGVILHNMLYGLSEIEEPASFLIAIVGLFLFIVVTIGCFIVYLINRKKITQNSARINTT